jgi:hypothetical protein
MIGQSRTESLKEGIQNIIVGIAIQSAANWLVLPWFGFVPSAGQLAGIAAIMTVISLARSYTLRRFNERKKFRDLPAEDWEALDRIKCERIRQVKIEGFDKRHDDHHTKGELARGAAAYALAAAPTTALGTAIKLAASIWPWTDAWFKPSHPARNCEKSGAMIVAQLASIIRTEKRVQQ